MMFSSLDRLAFGFHNPNHAAALVCALPPRSLGGGGRPGSGAAFRTE